MCGSVKVAHITTVDMSLRYLLLDQLLSIQQAGYKVAGISAPGPDAPVLEAAGIRHIPIFMTRTISPWTDLDSLRNLYRVMRCERFTIVHTHNPKPGLLGQLAARIARVPVVVNTLHGFYFHEHMHPLQRRFFIALERLAARCSDLILSQNREDMRFAISEGICSAKKIKYLGNGIDLTRFEPAGVTDEDIANVKRELGIPVDAAVLGFVGRLAAKRKGFLDFLAASRAVRERWSDTRFLIVGEADHGKPDAVEPAAAAEYGIADACLFVGHQPNHRLPLLYSAMNVLILPSLFEGVPRVVMEASAMQVPVVVTDVKGNREAVQHGQNGLLVPLGDVQALADAIVDILTDREKAERMGRNGRRIALERFDERRVFEKVKTEYRRLLQEKGIPIPQSSNG